MKLCGLELRVADWKKLSEEPVDEDVMVLFTIEDWPPAKSRGEQTPVKVGYLNSDGEYVIFGASWKPTHWQPLPKSF